MITRRGFLLGGATAGASGLVLPSFLDRALAHVEDHGEPLLEAVPDANEVLYATLDDFGEWVLSLGKPLEEVPVMTYEQLWTEQYGSFEQGVFAVSGFDEEEFAEDPELLGLVPDRDQLAEPWEVLDGITLPEASAFLLLSDLDLRPTGGHDAALGDLVFIDGPCPGSDYMGVHTANASTLSCLQHRLDLLGTGISVWLM